MENERTFNRTPRTELGAKKKKKWLKPVLIAVAVLGLVGAVAAWKAGSVFNKISTDGNIMGSLVRVIPGVADELKGEKEGRINILLLGMRGEQLSGGGLLADTIMVASILPAENKVSLFSIPRDLYVKNPGTGGQTKINAVYAYGEDKKVGGGMENMKEVVGEIVGQPIGYALAINFKGFTDLVNALGGVDVELEKPFEEAMQFNEERVCDSYVFTKKTGEFEYKYHTRKDGSKYVAAAYPLCTNPNTECGGDFKLPAGKQTLSGEQALCYARSRKTSSDFERARRQQMIIQKIKDKALSVGTLTDFGKINAMIDSLGSNIKTDLQAWEMKRMYELQSKMNNPEMLHKVLENNTEGLLYAPEQRPETGYILLPIGDNYNQIHNAFANIFATTTEAEVKPSN